ARTNHRRLSSGLPSPARCQRPSQASQPTRSTAREQRNPWMKAPRFDGTALGVEVTLDASNHTFAVHFDFDLRAHRFGVVFAHDLGGKLQHAAADLSRLHPA